MRKLATWGSYKKKPLVTYKKKEPKPKPSPKMQTGRGRIPLAQPIGSAGTRKQTVAFEGSLTRSPLQRVKAGLQRAKTKAFETVDPMTQRLVRGAGEFLGRDWKLPPPTERELMTKDVTTVGMGAGKAMGAAGRLVKTGVGKRKTFIALAKAWRKGAGKGAGAKLDQAAAGKAVKPKYYGMTKGGKLYTYNTKTGRLTHQLFTKMYTQFAKRPKTTGAALLAIIGSYPFSGFLKEEALQQAGWAVDEAIKEGDFERAEEALAFEKEMFNPDVADQIIQKIPFANIVASIKKFYDAVWIKHKTYEDTIERMKSGERDVIGKEIEARDIAKEESIAAQQEASQAHDIAMAERWEEYQQHKEDYDNETREYYEQRLIAEKASDLEMREFWADYQNRKFEYWEAWQKKKEQERPSKLGFGLLR